MAHSADVEDHPTKELIGSPPSRLIPPGCYGSEPRHEVHLGVTNCIGRLLESARSVEIGQFSSFCALDGRREINGL